MMKIVRYAVVYKLRETTIHNLTNLQNNTPQYNTEQQIILNTLPNLSDYYFQQEVIAKVIT